MTPHPDYPLDGVSLLPVLRDPGSHFARDALLAHEVPQPARLRAGDWKYLRVDGDEFLFDLAATRASARTAPPEPERLERCARASRPGTTMPPIPEDATVSLGYSVKDMPQR